MGHNEVAFVFYEIKCEGSKNLSAQHVKCQHCLDNLPRFGGHKVAK